MRKRLILILITIATLALIFIGVKYYYLKSSQYPTAVIPKNGFVPNKETALRIADVVLFELFGDEINDKKPFTVSFDLKKDAWIIEGVSPPNYFCGFLSIEIRKSDGKILHVSHAK